MTWMCFWFGVAVGILIGMFIVSIFAAGDVGG